MPAEPIRTRVAHAEWGDNRIQGYSVAHELLGTEPWLGIVALGVTGRRLAESERAILDDLGVVMTVADPRIWPLKLTRLVSSYGSTVAGLAAGALSLEDALIGNWSLGKMAELLIKLRASVNAPDDIPSVESACREHLESMRRIPGYGVAGRPVDERVTMLTERVTARGRDGLEYWTLFNHVSDAVFRMKGLRPNIASAAAAVCLDLGFNAREIATVTSFIGLSDYLPNAAEGAVQMAPALKSLDPASIRYVGPPPRDSGRG